MGTTKVFLSTKIAKRESTNTDETYLCYEPTTPPWDKEIVYVEDSEGRIWFVHTSDIKINHMALQELADNIMEDYKPRTEIAIQRRLHNPLFIQVVLSRASSLEELSQLLGTVKINRPSKGATP